MTLFHTRVTTALAALVTLGLGACADSPGPTGAAVFSTELGAANANQSFQRTSATLGWQEQTRILIASTGSNPINSARIYAIVSVAQYGAIVDVDDLAKSAGTPQGAVGVRVGGRRRLEAWRAGAVAGASQRTLSSLLPSTATVVSDRLTAEIAASPEAVRAYFTRGVAVGQAWGSRMLARPDRFTGTFSGTYPTDGTLYWLTAVGAAPAGPQFGEMKPYFLESPGQFHPAAPPAIGSEAFNTDLAEVTAFAANRTAEQLAAAQNLNLNIGSVTPVGRFNELAAQYIEQRNLDDRDAAHVFALSNAAAMDAVIGCWEAKYSYFTMRPWQANAAITSLPIGKPNHPSYPSGHSCVSASSAEVLKAFFPEHSASLGDLVVANGMSRIYAGIHYRFDITAGQTLGQSVARTALAYDRTNGLLAAVR